MLSRSLMFVFCVKQENSVKWILKHIFVTCVFINYSFLRFSMLLLLSLLACSCMIRARLLHFLTNLFMNLSLKTNKRNKTKKWRTTTTKKWRRYVAIAIAAMFWEFVTKRTMETRKFILMSSVVAFVSILFSDLRCWQQRAFSEIVFGCTWFCISIYIATTTCQRIFSRHSIIFPTENFDLWMCLIRVHQQHTNTCCPVHNHNLNEYFFGVDIVQCVNDVCTYHQAVHIGSFSLCV